MAIDCKRVFQFQLCRLRVLFKYDFIFVIYGQVFKKLVLRILIHCILRNLASRTASILNICCLLITDILHSKYKGKTSTFNMFDKAMKGAPNTTVFQDLTTHNVLILTVWGWCQPSAIVNSSTFISRFCSVPNIESPESCNAVAFVVGYTVPKYQF